MKFSHKIRDYIDTPGGKRQFNELHFTEAAPRYDVATRAMSLTRDSSWKRHLVDALPERPSPRCLDLACGTGDVTFLLSKKYPRGEIVGLDITESMLAIARERNSCDNVTFKKGDMSQTGFQAGSVDIVTASYALRNAPEIHGAIGETHRILTPGGVLAILDFSKSKCLFLQKAQCSFLGGWCGFWGFLLHGNPEIHGYIGESLRKFPDSSRFKKLMEERGFEEVFSRRYFLGIVEGALYRKSADS